MILGGLSDGPAASSWHQPPRHAGRGSLDDACLPRRRPRGDAAALLDDAKLAWSGDLPLGRCSGSAVAGTRVP